MLASSALHHRFTDKGESRLLRSAARPQGTPTRTRTPLAALHTWAKQRARNARTAQAELRPELQDTNDTTHSHPHLCSGSAISIHQKPAQNAAPHLTPTTP
jgi:hypothetical protein